MDETFLIIIVVVVVVFNVILGCKNMSMVVIKLQAVDDGFFSVAK